VALTAEQMADLMLADRCVGGERRATVELYRAYQSRVHGTLFRVLGSNQDMDDLMQETFVQVFRSLPRFRGEARLSTWIDRIAARVAYRYLARKKTALETRELDDEPMAPVEPADQRTFAREGVRRFYAALAELGPASRVAFVLHEVEGKPVAEVARCVGASATATKLRIWRARRALMKSAALDPVLAEFLSDVDPGGEQR
jgi:RNA polymerase sigma-70 factor, ECF subfamily